MNAEARGRRVDAPGPAAVIMARSSGKSGGVVSVIVLVGLLLAGMVVLTPLADRVRLPLPVLLTVYGLALPLVPGIPSLTLNPELILPVVLPPLLFAATQRSSAREFRDNAWPILLLAVGLTVATAGAVATVAHLGGVAWGPAWVLGAVVAPPDPVAATAVARGLRLPDRLVTVLEGEGMFNDATALVLYSVAVAAVVTGRASPAGVGLSMVLAIVVGVFVGAVAAVVTRRALAVLHHATAETTVTVAVPFATYLLAEHFHGSGVLAILVLGLALRTYGHSAMTSAGWLLGRAVWGYADYLITSLVFLFIGFELTEILEKAPLSRGLLLMSGAVVLTLVLLRFAWLFPASALSSLHSRVRRSGSPYGARETTVAAWAGMRGVVTVATALALPQAGNDGQPFPDRQEILFVGLACVLVTLVAQGLTLAPLVKALRLGTETDLAAEVAQLRRRAAEAALDTVLDVANQPAVPEGVRRAATLQYEGYLAAQGALREARSEGTDPGEAAAQLDRVLRVASEAERDLVLTARRLGEVSAAAADEVLDDIESRAVRDVD